MTVQPVPGQPPRLPLTRDRVLRAAIGLADEAGIESLSMRRLGQVLGVEAMSLYNHVANKDDILNGIVDIVESGIELPAPGAEWKSALRRTGLSARDVFVRHPWAASLSLSATGKRPARWRYVNAILGSLREAGFSADMTDLAYHALESHIAGFTLWAAELDIDEADLPDQADDVPQHASRRRVPVPRRARPSAPEGAQSGGRGLVRVRPRPDPRWPREDPGQGLTAGRPIVVAARRSRRPADLGAGASGRSGRRGLSSLRAPTVAAPAPSFLGWSRRVPEGGPASGRQARRRTGPDAA